MSATPATTTKKIIIIKKKKTNVLSILTSTDNVACARAYFNHFNTQRQTRKNYKTIISVVDIIWDVEKFLLGKDAVCGSEDDFQNINMLIQRFNEYKFDSAITKFHSFYYILGEMMSRYIDIDYLRKFYDNGIKKIIIQA
jgi:hypothetical protein